MVQNMFHRMTATSRQATVPLADTTSQVAQSLERQPSVGLSYLSIEPCAALALCLAPVTLRSMLLLEQSVRIGAADLHGYLSDVTVAVLLAVLLSAVVRRWDGKGRAVAFLTVLLWTIGHVGNYEHVKALGAPLKLTYAQYMKDGAFLLGSASSTSHAIWFTLLLVASVAGMRMALRQRRAAPAWQTRTIVVLALALANAIWPSDTRALVWRESDFLALMLLPTSAKSAEATQHASLPHRFTPNVQPDLAGEPIVMPRAGKPNVLLVILEGITGGSIPNIAANHEITQAADMPELAALAEKNIAFSTFITNQRQTNRGEFALLCGRLDYLVSGTSRMTEYAGSGGEPCLPRVLSDHGYRTMYLQSAPLSFMMKDQFMAKAGFAEVRGHDAYPQAYARSGWGVDDRAFFEQSAKAIQELDAKGSPWFATLLTVGTHHPYTVPGDFRTGTPIDEDPHGKAVRYLDHAVSAFVAQLEAAKVLNDTLLLITSDESFGVEGYDDVTKLLSYNWGFLVARVPGEGARFIKEPYAQTDVALSIADYLGVPAGPFVGRSLFRKYDNPRSVVFANTYQQKIYWAAPPEIVECDEALNACQKHHVLGSGLFSAQRTSAIAGESDVEPLREMVALSNTRHSRRIDGTTPLMLNNTAVWDMGVDHQGLVFGGQYFALEADQEVVVSVEATPTGRDAALLLDADLFARGMLYELYPPTLYSGDTLRFEYTYAPGKAQSSLEVRLGARLAAGKEGHLMLRKAEMNIRSRSAEQSGGMTTMFSIERARPMQTYFLGSGIAPAAGEPVFSTAPCVANRGGREFVALGCGRDMLLYGPYAKVPAGSNIRATFEILSEKGAAGLRGELVSKMGSVMYSRSDVVRVGSGDGTTVRVEAHVDEETNGVEARLGLVSVDDDASLVIRRALLEVFPPAQ